MCKKAFKKFGGYGLPKVYHIPPNFSKAVFHKFTWSILEYFVPHIFSALLHQRLNFLVFAAFLMHIV